MASSRPPFPPGPSAYPGDLLARIQQLEQKVAKQQDNIHILSITGTGLIFASLLLSLRKEPKRIY